MTPPTPSTPDPRAVFDYLGIPRYRSHTRCDHLPTANAQRVCNEDFRVRAAAVHQRWLTLDTLIDTLTTEQRAVSAEWKALTGTSLTQPSSSTTTTNKGPQP